MKRVVALASALAVCIACGDQHPITSPLRPSADFSDGSVPGGNPHFFFLPPLVKQPSFSGTFNPALRPVVEICQLDVDINNIPIGCSATVPTINPGIVQLDLVDEQYQVNWNTLLPPIDPTKSYRIQVRVAPGGSILGFADIDPVENGSELKNVNTGEAIGWPHAADQVPHRDRHRVSHDRLLRGNGRNGGRHVHHELGTRRDPLPRGGLESGCVPSD